MRIATKWLSNGSNTTQSTLENLNNTRAHGAITAAPAPVTTLTTSATAMIQYNTEQSNDLSKCGECLFVSKESV